MRGRERKKKARKIDSDWSYICMINKFRVFNFFSEYIKDDMNNFYVKVIAGCLVFVALILAAGFFTLVYQMRKTENAKKDD